MSGHTPGPWRVEPSYNPTGGELLSIGASYQWPEGEVAFVGLLFTPCFGIGPYAEHREADARLAAAAPELLEACKRLLNFNEELCVDVRVSTHYPSADFARAAIAKAEGRK